MPHANLGAVNCHKVMLVEPAAFKKRRVTKSRASQTENRQTTIASSASGDQKRRQSERRYSEDRIRVDTHNRAGRPGRVGEREVESDDALAEAALIVEQGRNDEKKEQGQLQAQK